MLHSLLLPLLLYMDFGGKQLYSFKTENCFIVKSNAMLPRFNRVCHRNQFFDNEVEIIKDQFNETPFSWFIDIHDQKAADILNTHGFFKYPESFSSMSAHISDLADTTYAPYIMVKEINGEGDREKLIEIIALSNTHYEQSEWAKAIEDLLVKGGQSIKLYIGFYADQPCAAGIIIYHDDAITLHLISTLPAYRCRGLGYAVVHKALFDAASNGISKALLLASSMAQSLYQKFGFKEYAQYHLYLYKRPLRQAQDKLRS